MRITDPPSLKRSADDDADIAHQWTFTPAEASPRVFFTSEPKAEVLKEGNRKQADQETIHVVQYVW